MTQRIIFSIVLLLVFKAVSSQIPVGLKYDLNGRPLDGYYDPLLYMPEKKLINMYLSESYEVGYYYDKTGDKKSGLIKFEDNKILFKEGENIYRDKLKPGEIQSFVIGVDSFFTVHKYQIRNKVKDKPAYVQFVSAFGDYTFVRHFHRTGLVLAGQAPTEDVYLVKSENDNTWEDFLEEKIFKKRALKYFGHIPYLRKKIHSEDYNSDDLLSMIKMAEYYQKFQDSEPVLYDEYWQEVRDQDKAVFKANITEVKNSVWTFEYFKDSLKLYEVHYTSFFPNTWDGDFTAFYPNGISRKVVTFKNNKPQEIKHYEKSGKLKSHIQCEIVEDRWSDDFDVYYNYLRFNDSSGKNMIKKSGKSTISDYDELEDVTYTRKFDGGKLVSSYRKDGAEKIFQITNPDYDFQIKKIQTKFENYMMGKDYEKALNVNAQGTILVSVVIDTKGYVVESNVLNKVHPELDNIVNGFVKDRLAEDAGFRLKFKPYKEGRDKQLCEVVIPIEFGINRFYRRPANYYYNNYWQMFHEMNQQYMMQHQMM